MGDHYKFKSYKNTDAAWRYFEPIIENDIGTSALIAGLYLRSGLDPFKGYENYTGVEPLELKDFAYDRKGFGIGKWKNWARKQSLYNYTKKAGVTIYDLHSQMAYVMDELSGITYGPVMQGLKDATDLKEAAYMVYDRYLDIKKPNDEARIICGEIAEDIFKAYALDSKTIVPVKYVKAEARKVRVNDQRSGGVFSFLRKKIGYLAPERLYPYVGITDNAREYIIQYNDQTGFVKAHKVQIVTRFETTE